MKKLLTLLLLAIITSSTLLAQNKFKYVIQALGGISIGNTADTIRIDSVILDGTTVKFYRGSQLLDIGGSAGSVLVADTLISANPGYYTQRQVDSLAALYLLEADTLTLSNRIDLKADTVDQSFTGTIGLPTTTEYNGVRVDSVFVKFTGSPVLGINVGANAFTTTSKITTGILQVSTTANAVSIDSITTDGDYYYVYDAADTLPSYIPDEFKTEGLSLGDSAKIVGTKSIGEGTYLTGHDADSMFTALSSSTTEFGRLEFIVDTTLGAPVTGDSILTVSDFIDKHIEVSRGTGGGNLYKQYRKSVGQTYHNGYSFQKATGTVVFTPSFTTGEHVIIESSDSTYWTNIEFENPLNDGNTKAWYIAAEEYLTKDGEDSVAVWLDATDNNRDLSATNKQQPIWATNYITFNGSTNRLSRTDVSWSDIAQPVFIYAVIKPLSAPVGWEDENFFLGDGKIYIKQNYSTPDIAFYAGGAGDNLSNCTIDATHIIRALAYGANGHFQVDKGTAATSDHDFGTDGLENFYVGNNSTTAAASSNIAVYEIIIRNHADDATEQNSIYNYLKVKYGL